MLWFPQTIIVVNPMCSEITRYSWEVSSCLAAQREDLAVEREMVSSFLSPLLPGLKWVKSWRMVISEINYLFMEIRQIFTELLVFQIQSWLKNKIF